MYHIIRFFDIVEHILRNRLAYFAEISRGEKLPGKIVNLMIVMISGATIFGFVAGLSGHDIVQALISMIKLPALFLISGLICLPTLYYFSILFGSRLRFLQTIALILTAQTVSAVLALGFAPISLLFLISGSDPLFLVALNISVLGLAITLGLIFLMQGALYVQETQPPTSATFSVWAQMFIKGTLRSVVLVGWLTIYVLVSAQLSWMMRPFFGVPLHGHDFFSSMSNIVIGLLGSGE